MKIAILALQGAFAEHEQVLQSLGADTVLIRSREDFERVSSASDGGLRGLVIPGGESTAMMRIMQDEGLEIQDFDDAGYPEYQWYEDTEHEVYSAGTYWSIREQEEAAARAAEAERKRNKNKRRN